MQKTQMIKGFIEGFILEVLSKESLSSSEIIHHLKDTSTLEISEGTMYPLMLRMEKEGFVISKQIYNPSGPRIKMYAITPQGTEEKERIKKSWQIFKEIAEKLLGD
ncbi:MAG: PadR family transcriptional regulator [Acholeplasma sp.]